MSTSLDIRALLKRGYATKQISRQSIEALRSLPTLEQELLAAVTDDDLPTGNITLVTVQVDDSPSIWEFSNQTLVVQGHNMILKRLREGKGRGQTVASTRFLNGGVFEPYRRIARIRPLSLEHYHQRGGTPLYEQGVILLGGVMAKTQALEALGNRVRSITFIITDGEDTTWESPQKVAWLSGDLMNSGKHIVAAMGIKNERVDFVQVFQSMGIARKWIIAPNQDPQDILAAFDQFAEAATQAALSSESFTRLALGPGFGR